MRLLKKGGEEGILLLNNKPLLLGKEE